MRSRTADVRGFVTAEFAAAVAVLLLPTLLLVATMPEWAERRHAAIVAARTAAEYEADVWPADRSADAAAVARVIVTSYGVPADDLSVAMTYDSRRGGEIVARATVRLPAISVFGAASIGAWSYTAVHHRRVDDYRTR